MTPEERLRALAAGQAGALETLAMMQASTLESSRLDRATYLLVRLAALVATDAAPVAYRTHLAPAGELGVSPADVLGTLAAIAPIVGSARIQSAAATLARAGLLPTGAGQGSTSTS